VKVLDLVLFVFEDRCITQDESRGYAVFPSYGAAGAVHGVRGNSCRLHERKALEMNAEAKVGNPALRSVHAVLVTGGRWRDMRYWYHRTFRSPFSTGTH